MKNFRLFFPALFVILTGCQTVSDSNQVLEDIQENLDFGNIGTVIQITDSINKLSNFNKETLHIADSLKQIGERIKLDFSLSEKEADSQLKNKLGSFSSQEKAEWENKGWLEWRMIDGEKKYFTRAVSNLLLIKKFNESKEERLKDIGNDPEMILRLHNTGEIFNASVDNSKPVLPVKMEITYTITVHPDAVPQGQKIRCWLPWPKTGNPRQTEIKLISTSKPEYTISPDTAIHSTLYMEENSMKGIPTVFQITYLYVSSGQYFKIPGIKIHPYNLTDTNYLKYTSEQPPHICFTDEVKRLTDSITGNEENPAAIVRLIYYWFKENIPWAGALEYSIIPNIPEYVIRNRRGDCGMQTFLFMSMLRYKGIPVRWQSGWMMPPDSKNLHDWCEVYYEGTGWVPVDVSYDLQNSENIFIKDFYLSGIDSYRLIVNDGVGGPLHPAKNFLRSEPSDFQRGEVEWIGGNLYFDKWDYDMKIDYLK
jgi:transglutaminase-like putative cysteine protease